MLGSYTLANCSHPAVTWPSEDFRWRQQHHQQVNTSPRLYSAPGPSHSTTLLDVALFLEKCIKWIRNGEVISVFHVRTCSIQFRFVCVQLDLGSYLSTVVQILMCDILFYFVCVQYNLRFYVSNTHPTSHEGPNVLYRFSQKRLAIRSTWYMT